MGEQVETVAGPVDRNSLGRVLMHEHIFIITYDYWLNYPQREGFDEERFVGEAIEQLADLKGHGIDTIVDLTVFGMGRYIPRIRAVAEASEINIVAATGMYIYESLPMPFHYQGPAPLIGGRELLVDMFVEDIVEGIAGTGVKAGIIKCATDEVGMTPQVERVVRAAAHASAQTGTPISTHTHAAKKVGNDQVRVFEEEGVDLARVVIGHSGDTADLDYLTGLLAKGVTLGMDRFGTETPLTTKERVDVIAELCRQGFSSQLVLSHDAAVFNDLTPLELVREPAPEWNFTFIPRTVLGMLEEQGVTPAMIDDMLVGNPRRILAG